MHTDLWPLIGIGVVIVGFVARINPLLVILAAVFTTGFAASMSPQALIAAFGKAFNENRYVSVVWVVLAVIGLLEREGLQERARIVIGKVKNATTGRILMVYFAIRQFAAAIGLTSLGGHPQMVRPLIAPMAEAAAETRYGAVPDKTRNLIRAHAAAADNIALFFGEDIFIAIASILLIKGFLETNAIVVEPLHLSLWAIPTAICAFLIHTARLLRLDARLNRELGAKP